MLTFVNLNECADVEWMRVLRNLNKEWFGDSRDIDEMCHKEWVRQTVQNCTKVFYVIHYYGRAIGTMSLTDTGDGLEVGNLLLEESMRGFGYMSSAVRWMMERYGPARYFARVKPDNVKSAAVFLGLGFSQSGYDGKYNIYERTT